MSETWKVYQLNDCEWFVARSLDEAKAAGAELWGYDGPDAVAKAEADGMFGEEKYGDEPSELTEAEMDRMRFSDSDENDRPTGKSRTFREELANRVRDGLKKPEYFAGTES